MDIAYYMNKIEDVTPPALSYLLKAGCREYIVSSIQNPGIALDVAKKGNRQVFKVYRDGKHIYFSPGEIIRHLVTTARKGRGNIPSEAKLEEMLDRLLQELSNIPKDA